jgi:hypothetical protein
MKNLGIKIKKQCAENKYAILAIGTIVLINLCFFSQHFIGKQIFPWDFMSAGYHAQSVAWFKDGSIFSPPKWLPYGSMGFPAWWSLQSSAWYIPVQMLSWLQINYTLTTASALQAAHVGVGAFGVILLARNNKLNWSASTIAGILYFFSSIFYSNQQHVDIVRGAALLPYILHALHPNFIQKGMISVVWSGLILWQFLVAAYPGIIVSAFYTSAMLITMWSLFLHSENRLRYLTITSLVGLSSVVMSLVKWGPLLLEGIGSVELKQGVSSFHPMHFFTFLFRYDLKNLPGDVTMQSLWIPPLAFLTCGFLVRKPISVLPYIGLALLAMIAGLMSYIDPSLRDFIPGMSLSRMQHSDWRPTLHIALAIIGANFIDRISCCKLNIYTASIRTGIISIFILVIGCFSLMYGYKIKDIIFEIHILILFSIYLGFLMTRKITDLRNKCIIIGSLIFCVLSSYSQYIKYVPRTWRTNWSDSNETSIFGKPLSTLLVGENSNWERRPERLHYGNGVGADNLDIRFNSAWYTQNFATFGYDNVRSHEWIKFENAISGSENGSMLLDFVKRKSHALILSASDEFDISMVDRLKNDQYSYSNVSGITAKMLKYYLNGAVIKIETEHDIKLVENEIWYEGWEGMLHDKNGNYMKIDSYPEYGSLRAWSIPSGSWILTSEYNPKGGNLFKYAFISGAFGLLLIALISIKNNARQDSDNAQKDVCLR